MSGELKPFFPFYGSKWRDARRYPAPCDGVVCEPFAGSAGYATYFNPRAVTLLDVDPIIVGVWSYLIRVTPAEVLSLPDLAIGESIDDATRLPQEAKWLIGFWINPGSAQPKKKPSTFTTYVSKAQLRWGHRVRERLAAQVESIRHWKVSQGSYETAPRDAGTYFVDPPYMDKGRYYRFRSVDYAALGAWCRKLPGSVIVCEQEGATWLPFEPLATIKSTRGTSAEVTFLRGSFERKVA